jgi:hypothetical protein
MCVSIRLKSICSVDAFIGLEAEIVILRHQLNVLRRGMPSRARLTLIDRVISVWLYRFAPIISVPALGGLQPSILSDVVSSREAGAHRVLPRALGA